MQYLFYFTQLPIATALDLVYAETQSMSPVEVHNLVHCNGIPSPVQPLVDLVTDGDSLNACVSLESTVHPVIHSGWLNNSKITRIASWPGKRNRNGKVIWCQLTRF